jgi:uncharacterized membrane protein YtjA (UPF0391 family)
MGRGALSYTLLFPVPTARGPVRREASIHPPIGVREEKKMLHYAVVFFVIALIAGVLGFTGIAASAAGIAKILFVVFLVVALVTFLLGKTKRT